MGVRVVLRTAVAAMVFAGVISSGGAFAATASAAPQYRHYVALGDSYTSGPLIPWLRFDPIGCFRSTNNYPKYLSRQLGISYQDRSCAGADTGDMTSSQSIPFGSNPPQFDTLRPETDLVTVGIGGNDFGTFGDLVGVCPTLRDSDPTGSPCKEHFTVDGVDTIRARMPRIQANVAGVLEGIMRRSPDADVVIVGYPRLVPPEGTCPDVMPLADGDYAWADEMERVLNRAIRKAAKRTGAIYVDTYKPSRGHDACAGDDAWVNGQHTNIFRAAAYHPFRAYMAAAGSLVYDALAGRAPNRARAEAAARAAAWAEAAAAKRARSQQRDELHRVAPQLRRTGTPR